MSRPPLPSNWFDAVASWSILHERVAEQPTGPRVRVHLLRHGETARNADGLVTGAADVPLTELGRVQAIDAGRNLLSEYHAAFCSNLNRSIDTLELALAAREAKTRFRAVDRRLAERSLGDLEGLPARPISAYDAGDLTWAPAGGESYLMVTRRILAFLLDLRDVTAHLSQPDVLICSHMGPMRVLVAILERNTDPARMMTERFPNARVLELQIERVAWPAFLAPSTVLPTGA